MSNVEVIKASTSLSSKRKNSEKANLKVAAYCRVSTDSEDQLNSYKSQVSYYTDYIKKKKEWTLADIYADEAITGTQVGKREDFQRMMNDCKEGKIDMIITKSISRFARNTLDTLKYVRNLKQRNIAVFFEEENINTLTMDGELLLVILSSVAQQEVENISANVKKGLKMKMQRGEMVGFVGCLGYDYDQEKKIITINEEEAETVRYIFKRYLDGMGAFTIAHELEDMKVKTKYGNSRWHDTTVMGILKNEKYIGDLRMGKTFTVDPISKRRLDNKGEEDQFYVKDHHEPIIEREAFEKVQEILSRRSKKKGPGNREKLSRKYAFSSMIECGFCGSSFTRKSWNASTIYKKPGWQCVGFVRRGKKFCPDSKGVDEDAIEAAFIESYKRLTQDDKGALDAFLQTVEQTLTENNASREIERINKDIALLESKRKKLVDMHIEGIIDRDIYEEKLTTMNDKLSFLKDKRTDYQNAAKTEKDTRKRIDEFREALNSHAILEEFDRNVFESIVSKVIIGSVDEEGNKDPYAITFIYKSGFTNKLDVALYKKRKCQGNRGNRTGLKKCSNHAVEDTQLCSNHNDDTRRDGSIDVKGRSGIRLKALVFRHFSALGSFEQAETVIALR